MTSELFAVGVNLPKNPEQLDKAIEGLKTAFEEWGKEVAIQTRRYMKTSEGQQLVVSIQERNPSWSFDDVLAYLIDGYPIISESEFEERILPDWRGNTRITCRVCGQTVQRSDTDICWCCRLDAESEKEAKQ